MAVAAAATVAVIAVGVVADAEREHPTKLEAHGSTRVSLPVRSSLVTVIGIVVAVSAAGGAHAAERLWIWFDEDGTPNISDRHDSPDAVPFVIGTFEEVALRQQNTPHKGLGDDVADVAVPRVPADILALVTELASTHKVPRALVLAVVGVESGFRVGRVSSAGARGLMQLMPATAEDLEVDPDDPRQNVDGGTRYLAWLLRYFGDERLAIAAYNAGPGRVKRAGNQVPAIRETVIYVERVTSLRRAFARAGM